MTTFKRGGHIHVSGVAGVGMSAIAQALAWSFERVTGSDRHWDRGADLPVLRALRGAGIELVAQDGAVITAQTAAVVHSTAIEADNPDLLAAERAGVPLRHRARMLADLARGHEVLAVAGTAGKTTTTGMLGWLLEQLGEDPTMVNGGALVDWAGAASVGNARRGGADAPWVIEVDESDRSLLEFEPDDSILTNISQDHFSLEEVRELFRQYASQVRRTLLCGAGVREQLGEQRAAMIEVDGAPVSTADGFEVPWRRLTLRGQQPGAHNGWNALMAAECCARRGHDPTAIVEALARFRGIQRRMERVDGGGAVRVFDDYAHNPAKVAAAWNAVALEDGRVWGVWRPHGFGPLRSMMDGFAEAFAECVRSVDHLFILPVYDAGGTADRSINSDVLVQRLVSRGVNATWAESAAQFEDAVALDARPGDTVLVMGARDPELPELARAVARRVRSN